MLLNFKVTSQRSRLHRFFGVFVCIYCGYPRAALSFENGLAVLFVWGLRKGRTRCESRCAVNKTVRSLLPSFLSCLCLGLSSCQSQHYFDAFSKPVSLYCDSNTVSFRNPVMRFSMHWFRYEAAYAISEAKTWRLSEALIAIGRLLIWGDERGRERVMQLMTMTDPMSHSKTRPICSVSTGNRSTDVTTEPFL